jgi:hypothetical protein
MGNMEVQLLASFPDRNLMAQAIRTIRSQGAIDVRPLGDCGDNVPIEAGFGSSLPLPPFSISVWMERSRYRLAQDTIIMYRGTLLQDDGSPSFVFPQNIH